MQHQQLRHAQTQELNRVRHVERGAPILGLGNQRIQLSGREAGSLGSEERNKGLHPKRPRDCAKHAAHAHQPAEPAVQHPHALSGAICDVIFARVRACVRVRI